MMLLSKEGGVKKMNVNMHNMDVARRIFHEALFTLGENYWDNLAVQYQGIRQIKYAREWQSPEHLKTSCRNMLNDMERYSVL